MGGPTAIVPSFSKRVATIEKLYLAFNALRGPFANQVVVEGRGRIAPERLREAVRLSSAVNPGARLRLRGVLGRMSWVAAQDPRVTVVDDASWDGRGEAGAPFLDRPLDPRGPTCEVQLVITAERSYLIFRSLHAVMDGLGTFFWAQDVLRALRGEEMLGHPSWLTDHEFVAGVTDGVLDLPAFDALHPVGRADAITSGNEFRWRRITVEAPGEAPLVAALAVALAAEARRHEQGTVRFNIPADLRFFQKGERSTGNAIGTLFVDVAPDATVDGLARSIKDRLKAREHARFPKGYTRMRWLPLGAFRGAVKPRMAREHADARYSMSGTISFLGAVDPALVSAPGFTPTATFWIPPMADQSCFVSCNRFDSRLELLLAMPAVLSSRGRLEALSERLGEVVAGRRAAAA